MKVLKIIGIIVLVLIVLIAVASLLLSTESSIAKSVVINAPKHQVYQHVNNYKKYNNWSPWMKRDPNMKSELVGEDGVVGTVYKWEGNQQVGKGEQVFVAITPDTVKTKLTFKGLFDSYADVYLALDSLAPNETKATWGFFANSPRPFNVMGLVFDIEKYVGADYQLGLDSLKAIVERETLTVQNPTP